MIDNIYGLKAQTNGGKELGLSQFKGKVMLVVNTASKCGFTPQYKGLQELYAKYADQGLVILGFPCDQFAHQEPGGDGEIAQFCQRNFGVSFPLMAKVDVNGETAHPVFTYLRKKAPGLIGDKIKWNFTKFLISRDGRSVKRYAPNLEPERMEADILKALNA